jgi:hypothetical protein
MIEAKQQLPIPPSPWFEEELTRSENSGNKIGRNIVFLECLKVSRPKLILHKDSHLRLQSRQPIAGIPPGSERQIEHEVDQRIVLSHLISRWRKESKEDLTLIPLFAQSLNNRSNLLKLPDRSHMYPKDMLCGGDTLTPFTYSLKGFGLAFD